MTSLNHRLEDGLGKEGQKEIDTLQVRIVSRSSSDSSSNPLPRMTGQSPIKSLCLTFSTPLPPLPYDPPIPQPDLTPYTNPLTWPSRTKNVILLLSCIATFLCAYTAGAYSPPQELIQQSISPTPSNRGVLAGITTFCLGFAIAPMILAPFSEINGRYPVFVVSGIIYVSMQAVCGIVTTLPQMLAARFLVGVGASVFSTMVGGVIADMYEKKDRNTPMAVFSGFVLAGTGVGPLVAAVMAQRLEDKPNNAWKWVWWHQVLMGGLLMIALIIFFRESRGSVLLRRKSRKLNQWYESMEKQGLYGVLLEDNSEQSESGDESDSSTQADSASRGVDEEKGSIVTTPSCTSAPANTVIRIRWLVKEDESSRSSLGQMITISISRPFHLLFTEPVVFFFSAWVSFAWGILYLTFGSIPFIFSRVYGFSLEQSGYVFIALIVGAIIATFIAIWQERFLLRRHRVASSSYSSSSSPTNVIEEELEGTINTTTTTTTTTTAAAAASDTKHSRRNFLSSSFLPPPSSPESRLLPPCLLSSLLPIGLLLSNLTARPTIHFLVPSLGILLSTIGILSIYLAVFNYFADVYSTYASSALAAQSFCRNVLAGFFPLLTKQLYAQLGETKAGLLLGGIALLLTVVPWVLVFTGEKVRGRSPFASSLI